MTARRKGPERASVMARAWARCSEPNSAHGLEVAWGHAKAAVWVLARALELAIELGRDWGLARELEKAPESAVELGCGWGLARELE